MNDLPQGHALVIGINDYGNGITALHSAVKDASALSECLKTQHGYEVTCLVEQQANSVSIYDHLESAFPATLTEDSAFLLYFAGHGVARGDGSEGPKGFLLPQDAEPGKQHSWLSMERIRKALESYPCKHMLIILDCCFAGTFRWASTRELMTDAQPLYDSQYQRFLNGWAWQVLTSASHNEKAMDISPGRDNTRDSSDADGHSPFARALLDGLAGDADSSRGGHDSDGVITATELYQYTFHELVPDDAGKVQTPGIWPLRPDNEGQFIFHNPRKPKKTIPDPPLDDSNNPWLGLTAYRSTDVPLFFGRERVVTEIIDQILDSEFPRLIPIVGASGTGKSSVARAGVLPRLRRPATGSEERIGQWTVVQSSRLDAHPMDSLDKAVTELDAVPAGSNKLLYVDQFEELFTLCPDAGRRSEYLNRLRSLLEEDDTLSVIVTLRSDFEPRLANSAELGDLWRKSRYLVPAFSTEEFRECIEGPARVKALYFEPGSIVSEVIDEIMAMPGALPMLSFALSEMYRRAQQRRRETGSNDRALTRSDYEAIGGVVGSLHRRASTLFDAADSDTQASIKRVFLRLLSQDGARLARRRVELTELKYADDDEQARVEKVLNDYIDARLLVVDSGEIEPAHDTLIVAWEKLLDWLSESGPQSLIRALWRAATVWRDSDRDKGLTWHDDPRLPLAKTKGEELNELEQTFVHASEKRRKGLRNRFIGIAVAVVLVLAGIGLYAVDRSLEALYRADEAQFARETRDNTYLDLMERGNFFRLGDVLGDDSQGGLVVSAEPWRQLVTVPEGTFVAGGVFGNGRIVAIGHEALLTYVDSYGESLFLDLALTWLAAEYGPSLYFTSGHNEALAYYHQQAYEQLRQRLFEQGYDFDAESLPPDQAIKSASVLIIGNAWSDFSEEEMNLIEEHVFTGGGLLVAGLGWSWKDNGLHEQQNDPQVMEIYPMNKLMQRFGLVWSDQPIWPE